MITPPRWSRKQLQDDLATSKGVFKRERLQEPLEEYLEAFDSVQATLEDLFETTVDLTQLHQTALGILTNKKLLVAFRYLAGPFISLDDLKTVAETPSLSPKRLNADPDAVARIIEVVLQGIDRRRFPWVSEGREPTEVEKNAAVLATATLMATSRVGTSRRSSSKAAQEERVQDALIAAKFTRVATREVATLSKAPQPGQFCRESLLGTRKADFIVGLWDGRLMPVECKVSNSATNSVKRLNNDAAVKAVAWRKDFGETQVVPVAILSGVYKIHNLEDAQKRGLTLFWAHELRRMVNWVKRTQQRG